MPSEVQADARALAAQIHETLAAVDGFVACPDEARLDHAAVNELVTAAIRLFYVTAGEREELAPDPTSVSPSEALTLVAALLTAHDISTFDLALWLSRTRGR